MGKFTTISETAFKEFQADAGVLLKKFNPVTAELVKEDIICATTGGIKPSCVPTYRDEGENVDNCPPGMKELKKLVSWETRLGFTALNATPESIRMSLGAADVDEETGKITPRADLKDEDFKDIWWVGDRADGGFVAVCLKNALSTDGFSMQTTKDGKGQLSLNLMGHYSIKDQKTVPMEFYSTVVKTEENTEPEENTEE